jgi:hypothetical protein
VLVVTVGHLLTQPVQVCHKCGSDLLVWSSLRTASWVREANFVVSLWAVLAWST